ncbi:unnamed protein product [Cladocopium goreaui]|uniref:Nuclear pore complex protein Nup98-Nup96 n=1 Tax=Cladocopium goreaui TaxID=2562237 RepID=A0A9P1CG51_9DINO|nr:unnamed protein product [Cladocopium goreaui]
MTALHSPRRALSPPRLEIPVLPEVPAMAISFNLPSTPVSRTPEPGFRSFAEPPVDRPTSPSPVGSPCCGHRPMRSPSPPPAAMAMAMAQMAQMAPLQFRSPSPVPSMSSTAPGGTSPWRRQPGEAPANLAPAPGRHAVPGTGLEALCAAGPAGSITQRLNDTHLVPLRHMLPLGPRSDSQTTQSTVMQAALDPSAAPQPQPQPSPLQGHRVVRSVLHPVPQPVMQPVMHPAMPYGMVPAAGTPVRAACCQLPPGVLVAMPPSAAPGTAPLAVPPVLRFSAQVASPRPVATSEAARQVHIPQEPPLPSSQLASPATPPHRLCGAPEGSPRLSPRSTQSPRGKGEDGEKTDLPAETKGEDSLSKQLRELQHAKEEAAAQVAQSEQAILMRKGQLKRETFLALKSGGLSEALRRWPSPEHPAGPCPAQTPSPRESRSSRAAMASRELQEESEQTEAVPLQALELEESPLPQAPVPPVPSTDAAPERTPPERTPPECTPPELPVTETLSRGSRMTKTESLPERLTFEEEAVRCCKTLNKIGGQISSEHLRDLRKPRQLPPQVVKLLQAIALLLGHKDVKVSNLKKLLADTLPQKLSAFDPRRITQLQRTKLRALLSSAEVQPDQIATLCLPFTSLAQWCECVMIFLSHTQMLQSEKEKEKAEKAEEPQTKPSRSSRGLSSLQIQPDLTRLSPEQLKEVKDLTITKPNIGSVVFHGTTDCSTLDLQKDIVLKRGYVLVYPDTKRKPPLGEGLNKPATVTMGANWR